MAHYKTRAKARKDEPTSQQTKRDKPETKRQARIIHGQGNRELYNCGSNTSQRTKPNKSVYTHRANQEQEEEREGSL